MDQVLGATRSVAEEHAGREIDTEVLSGSFAVFSQPMVGE